MLDHLRYANDEYLNKRRKSLKFIPEMAQYEMA